MRRDSLRRDSDLESLVEQSGHSSGKTHKCRYGCHKKVTDGCPIVSSVAMQTNKVTPQKAAKEFKGGRMGGPFGSLDS